MPLTAHQRLRLARRFPEARIELVDEFWSVIVAFPGGDSVWGMAGARSEPGSVMSMPAAGYHSTSAPMSEDTQAAEEMLREFLGCP